MRTKNAEGMIIVKRILLWIAWRSEKQIAFAIYAVLFPITLTGFLFWGYHRLAYNEDWPWGPRNEERRRVAHSKILTMGILAFVVTSSVDVMKAFGKGLYRMALLIPTVDAIAFGLAVFGGGMFLTKHRKVGLAMLAGAFAIVVITNIFLIE